MPFRDRGPSRSHMDPGAGPGRLGHRALQRLEQDDGVAYGSV